MNVSAIQNVITLGPFQVAADQITQRRILLQAVSTINANGLLGEQRDLVFILDRASHRAIMQVVDRQTREVVMELPQNDVMTLSQRRNG
jgi:uncharacterized FlaG/YvyC family protein